jgi:tetratricopeptide (TPR) repeat protein
MVLIGQRAVLESDLTLALDRLQRSDIEHWLRRLRIPYTAEELAQLERYTGGNPRLLTLCMTLHQLNQATVQEGAAVAAQLAVESRTTFVQTLLQLPHIPALAPIWDRLRARLTRQERQLLQALAVFRTPAPADGWPHLVVPAGETGQLPPLATALIRLRALQLIHGDEAGGIWLLPMLRETLYEEMAIETRESYHIRAAQMYAARGDYTEAAYHFWRGDQPDRAVAVWFSERQNEIKRGQAGAALAFVEQISAHRLKRPQQKQLALMRAELYGLLGEPARVVDSLAAIDWQRDEAESVEALRLWGDALNVQGDAAGAQEKLAEGVQVVAYLLEQHAHLHVQRGLIHLQQREMKAAWQEATRARYYAENLQGAIQANLGNYETARGHYEVALTLAAALVDTQAAARTEYYLGIAAMQQQDVARAFCHYQAAIADYQQVGNRVQEVYVRSNLAAAYLTAGDYTAAITEAKQALAFCERMNAPYWMAMNAANLAEAYFELGDLDHAERYALQVIEHEEVDSYPYALYTLGSVRRVQQRPNEAIEFYRHSARIAEQNEDRFLLAYAHRGMGQVYSDQEATTPAMAALQQALTLFEQLGIDAEAYTTTELIAGLCA